MSEEEFTLKYIKGEIADLPPEEQVRITSIADQMRELLKGGGGAGVLALTLVGAEVQVGRIDL